MSRFFFYPRTHRSLRERLPPPPPPPPPPARFASDSLLASRAKTPARFASDSLLASRAKNRLTSLNCLQIYSNCLRFFGNTTPIIDLRACTLQLCFRDKDFILREGGALLLQYSGNLSVRKSDFLKAQGILRRIFLNFKKAQGTSGRIFLIPRHLEAHFLIS